MDPSAPNPARMIDYWLGGQDHYPMDVAAAGEFETLYGPCAHEFRALRGFLGRAVLALGDRGVREFLVVGGGIPTQGNVHQVVPGARVLYVDVDPEIVAAGARLLDDVPDADYVQGDASALDPDLPARALPGWGTVPVGIVFLGLAAFLDDATLARTFADLAAATAPGSLMAFDFDSEVLLEHPEALAFMGPGFTMRDPVRFEALLGPWRLLAPIAPVADWPDPGSTNTSAAFYGSIAINSPR